MQSSKAAQSAEELEEVNDLPSLVRAVTAEAYELAAKRGRLPEQIEVKANFDMDDCGRLRLNQSRSFPGLSDRRKDATGSPGRAYRTPAHIRLPGERIHKGS